MTHHGSFRMYDEQERRKWQNPEAILVEIGLQPGMILADIGCGQGFFSIPAAKIVGDSGKVYCLDINPSSIDKIREKASAANVNNLSLRSGKAEDELLCDACADIVFFGIALHDFEDPLKVLANAKAMLKPTGKLVNLDWKKEPMEFGPPLHIRFDEEKAKQLIATSGFTVQLTKKSGQYHYLIVAGME